MFNSTLISPDSHWLIWAVLFSAAAFSLWSEKTKIGSKISAVVVAILFTFVLSNLSIIPTSAPAYDIVWSYLVPLAIPLLLFKADLRKILKEAGPTLLAFAFGGIGTVLGTIIAYNLIPLGEEGWKLAGIFCSTYVGGSMNYVAAAEALQLNSPALLTAGIAADNLIMTLYFILLFAIPSMKFLQKRFKTIHDDQSIIDYEENEAETARENPDILSMAKALAIGFSISAIGFLLEDLFNIPGSGILFITAIVVTLATSFPAFFDSIKGADKIGTLLMQVFFAAIGASANIKVVLDVGPILFLFAGLILLIHLIFLLGAGKIFNIDLAEIVIASNANMGGPTTAAAMAVAKRWRNLVIPAILCGTLGYAIATFVGVAVGYWLK